MMRAPPAIPGSVVLLESETGSGKTEAAIAHGMRLYRAGAVDGIYFALPTRTSGVQMHRRLRDAVAAAFGPDAAPPVLLAVPGYMRVDDNNAVLLGNHRFLWDERDGRPDNKARGWFAENSKRYLAAPIAAGTIDQVLMSVIRAKHAHMRAASFARNLLVIDEVHASDDYMTELTAEVVKRHVAAGGHVLLMSATLGAEAARRYLGGPQFSLPSASALAYPLIRWRSGISGAPVHVDAVPGEGERISSKDVRLQVCTSIADDLAVATLAATHARAGAKVLVIRNTVDGCVNVRRLLSEMLPDEAQFRCSDGTGRMTPAPHHGRFAAEDRKLLDVSVEVAFGKKRPVGGMVLVATQTVEQSLDIDADILITDICPMDVLLQRIGRLHRHERPNLERGLTGRPDAYLDPVCIVLVPADGLLPLVRKAGFGIGKDRAYEDVRVVELTLREIVGRGRFVIPEMNRALVEATVHSEARAALDVEDEAWAAHGAQVLGKAGADRWTARSAFMSVDAPFGDQEQYANWATSKLATRLGEGSVSALFPPGQRPVSPFSGLPIPLLNIAHWMSPPAMRAEAGRDALPEVIRSDASGFAFTLAGETYEYDADGLRRAPRN